MLVVETVARVRRAYFVQEKSIKEIARDLKVSRKTVRKVIRSGATSFHYARGTQPAPKLGPWRDALDGLLLTNAGKSARERLTLMRLFEALRGLGYEGGYDAVRRYARTWRRERSAMTADAYVPLSFAPGEAYQFDWSHEVVLIDGVTVKIKVAHVRLCHSRMPFVRAYPRESQEMVFDAHDRAFVFFKGACQRGIYDNMKTAVETIFAGRERAYNRRTADVQPLPRRPGRLHAGVGLGEGAGRESGRARARALLHSASAGEELRGAERLACRPSSRLREGPSSSRVPGPDDLAGLRGRAGGARALCGPVRRLPCGARIGVEALPRALRQQPLLRRGQRDRAARRGAGLCRTDRDPAGRPRRCRSSACLRARSDGVRSLALRACARPQAWRTQERCSLQELGPAERARPGPEEARHRRGW